MIRFLISDVDGTLVTPDKVLTRAAVEAVADLQGAGVGFAFVSSRPPRGLAAIAHALETAGDAGRPVAAAFNGGALLDARLEPLSFTPLPDADARTALAHFASLGIDAWVFTLDAWYLTNPDAHYVAHEEHTVGFGPSVVASFDGIDGIGKIVGSSTDPDLLRDAEASLAAKLSPSARGLRSQTYYLDVTHADANKGAALRAIAAHEGLALDEIAAIGDMQNDLSMLSIAGLSIAMGNAPDEVKAQCNVVTTRNDDEGFATAVRRFVMPAARRP